MTLSPRLRKLVLTLHVATAVGWLGAVLVFLGIAIVGVTSEDPPTVRGVYLVMEPAGWFVLVPLAAASLVTGLVQALATPWGLVRHYWVIFKLVITVFATGILLLYTHTFSAMAHAAETRADLDAVRSASPVLHSAGGFLLLLTATILAVYKPRGTTRYARRANPR